MGRKVIVHVINGLGTGGAETMLLKLLSCSDRSRFEPVVVSLLDKGTIGPQIEALGVRVFTLNMTQGVPSLRSLLCLGNILRQHAPDVVQGWMYHANLAITLARWLIRSNVPLVWNVRHSLHQYSSERLLTRLVIRLCAGISTSPRKIIYNSSISARQHETQGFERSATMRIPNGFDTEEFRPDRGRRNAIRKELNIAEEVILIGLVARYDPIKDHQNFLLAAAMVAKRYSNVHFLLVGREINHTEGPVACGVRALGIARRVTLLGERKDISSLNAALDIMVSSSRSEAFPNSVGEAMACGVPCVVTDVGDSQLLVDNTGIVVQPGDPEAMADGIKRLLRLNRKDRQRLGVAARERIIKEFALQKIVDKYEEMYGAICAASADA